MRLLSAPAHSGTVPTCAPKHGRCQAAVVRPGTRAAGGRPRGRFPEPRSPSKLPLPSPTARPLRRQLPAAAAGDPHGADSGSPSAHSPRPQHAAALRRPPVDPDLLEVLELATDEELETVYSCLTGRSLFSPLVKSLVEPGEPVSAALHGRDMLIARIDSRLRFLAADSASTLKGRWPAYRQVLLMIRDRLGIQCPPTLLTSELEAEVFLHLLERHADAVADVGAGGPSAAAAAEYADQGDGGTAAAAAQQQGGTGGDRPGLLQRLLAPLRLGREEVVPALLQLGSALAVSNLQGAVVQRLGLRLAHSHLRYEAALHLALSAGAKGVQGKVAVKAAKEGITAAASRYAAARSLLGVLGPIVWASTALELLLVSVGTDYSRVVKAVFVLAQIRLLRTYGFSGGSGADGTSAGGSSSGTSAA